MLTAEECTLVKRLAGGEHSLSAAAETIYRRYRASWHPGTRDCIEMDFLYELFNTSPNYAHRYWCRQQVLAKSGPG